LEIAMSQRLDFAKAAPDIYRAYLAFNNALKQTSIEQGLRDLVNIRVSQMNGCGFCVDMHTKEATIHGERPLRLHHVAIWRESPLFSDRERAAFAWAEVLTHLPVDGVPDEAYDQARAQFGEKGLAELTYAIMAINGWNRSGVGFRTEPGSRDAEYGLTKAGLS
jgi:AhpD family alkylhydroperoxidase